MEQTGNLILFRVQLGGGAQRGVRQSVMPRELPHMEPLEAGHGFTVMKELAPPEQFVKDMFRFPRARQSVFRVGDADYQRSAVPRKLMPAPAMTSAEGWLVTLPSSSTPSSIRWMRLARASSFTCRTPP